MSRLNLKSLADIIRIVHSQSNLSANLSNNPRINGYITCLLSPNNISITIVCDIQKHIFIRTKVKTNITFVSYLFKKKWFSLPNELVKMNEWIYTKQIHVSVKINLKIGKKLNNIFS